MVDVAGLYPNIPHEEDLPALRKRLDNRMEKYISSDTLCDLAELEEEFFRKAEFKLYLWWRNIDDIFFLWDHGEEKLKSFIDNINKMDPTIKFTADLSQKVY